VLGRWLNDLEKLAEPMKAGTDLGGRARIDVGICHCNHSRTFPDATVAAAATLRMRACTLWVGVTLGLAALLLARGWRQSAERRTA
jgi:hypothetical protein